MHRYRIQGKPCFKKHTWGISVAAITVAVSLVQSAEPRPLPPPPEVLDGHGFAIDSPSPGQGAVSRGASQPPPRQALATTRQPQPANVPASRPFTISPPAAHMPDEYFSLPMVENGIPGVLMPELDEDFVDPGMYTVRNVRPLARGMSLEELQPYFEQAKGSERAALEAKKYGDQYLFGKNLDKAVQRYTEILAMADAASEAREEAWYGLARCEYRRENWWRAFDALERSFPSKYDKGEVEGRIRLEMFIGERLWRMGHAPVPEARKDGTTMPGYQAAARVYTAALLNNPNSRDAPLALLRKGDAAAIEEDWQEAAKFYRSVVQHYPESEPAMQARSSLAEAVYRQEWPAGIPEAGIKEMGSLMAEVETTDRRLSSEAEERHRRAVDLANNEQAGSLLRQAKTYLSGVRVQKSRDSAVFLLGQVVSHYPETEQAREASELLQGMGIAPPMTLSDGSRFPHTRGWVDPSREAESDEARGGSVQVNGQYRRRSQPRQGDAPFSPVRDTPPPAAPVDVTVPGISPEM